MISKGYKCVGSQLLKPRQQAVINISQEYVYVRVSKFRS